MRAAHSTHASALHNPGIQLLSRMFFDMRAKAASDSDSDVAAQELLHHEDAKVTKRVYHRKVPTGTPCHRQSGA